MAQPVHVQQLLKLKQQAVQQQKAIQPQAAPGPAAVPQKVLGSCMGFLGLPVFTLNWALLLGKKTSEMLKSIHIVAMSLQPKYIDHVCLAHLAEKMSN